MRLIIYSIALLAVLGGHLHAQTFDAFLLKLQAAPVDRRQFMADSFMATLAATPLVDSDSSSHFLYQGQAQEVGIAGDHNGWNESRSPLTRAPNTNLWYRTDFFEADARLDYKIVVDKTWILDPRNPFTISGAFGPNSELRMPSYLVPLEIVASPTIPHGSIVDTVITSTELNNTRPVRIYLPPGYGMGDRDYPMVLFNDGLDYLRLASAGAILDNLIGHGVIPPVIAVFVPAVNRSEEYAGVRMDAFTRFIVQELLPVIDRNYRTSKVARLRAVLGSNNGGNIALYLGMKHPEVFGNIAAQSSNIQPSIFQRFDQPPVLPLRIYLDLGVYDIPILIPLVHGFVSILEDRKYEHLFNEFNEGHSWGSWRAHIDNALTYFFASLLSVDNERHVPPTGIELGAAWPNPATSMFRIQIRVPQRTQVHAALYDALGRLALVVADGTLIEGSTTLDANTSSLPRGIYHLQVSVGGVSQLRTIKLY